MRIIGVTGPSGSGKTLLGAYFSRLGVPSIDADSVYHSMLIPPSPCLDAIHSAFGDGVLFDDGSLNRGALSGIVFHDRSKLELLNRTVLDLVLERIREMIKNIAKEGAEAVIVDAPTLIESGFYRECDVVVTVLSPKEQRVHRISLRDSIDESKALERVSAQRPDEFYTAVSDHVICNDTDEQAFTARLDELAAILISDTTKKKGET